MLSYELVVNLDVNDGLTNGAVCSIKRFDFKDPNVLKGVIWVLFEDPDVGKEARKSYEKSRENKECIKQGWTPIKAFTREFPVSYKGGKHIRVARTQFPFKQSTARTVHKAQGLTVKDKIVIDFGSWSTKHMHYVALSRVDKIEKLHLENIEWNKVTVDKEVVEEMKRLRKVAYPFNLRFLHQVDADIKISFINAQSLRKHFNDIKNDRTLKNSDVIICSETWYNQSDLTDENMMEGFTMKRFDVEHSNLNRQHNGQAIFYKKNLTVSDFRNHTSSLIEMFECTISTQDHAMINLFGLYSNPRNGLQNLIDFLGPILSPHQEKCSDIIIGGDFNLNLLENSSNSFLNFMKSLDLIPKITESTTNNKTC